MRLSTGNEGKLPIFAQRKRGSTVVRKLESENFYSDKSRIVFCSSFRRLMQKAQVFSLEQNTSVRNRLTHSLEVADVGRTLARKVGQRLLELEKATYEELECMQSIVETACLLHDIGNPPFGHFGEEAIKSWFGKNGPRLLGARLKTPGKIKADHPLLNDFMMFDGNPQGFRIATRLHNEIDEFGLNLTYSALLASVKYPNSGAIKKNAIFPKKLGVYSSESRLYDEICKHCRIAPGTRYFLAYLMELADDICYCLSDIADSFEKGIITSCDFKENFGQICKENGVEVAMVLPEKPIEHFSYEVSKITSRKITDEAAEHFATNLDKYIAGKAKELIEDLPTGKVLKCFKLFARKYIYTNHEAQRIEIAGSRIVEGLLDHFGRLLELSRQDFTHFVEKAEMPKGSRLDTEWRIFNQLSHRMTVVYRDAAKEAKNDSDEWLARARLMVDYVSGLTDQSALNFYQNFMGIKL